MMKKLQGKICLVTGGASGIGEGVALGFAREGATVIIADLNGDGAKATAQQIIDSGGTSEGILTDMSDEKQIAALFKHIDERYGRLNVLYTSAFWAVAKNVEETTLDEWNKCMAVTLTAPYLCSKHAIPLIRKAGGGSIIHTSSAGGVVMFRNHASYTTAKAGIIHLCKSIAVDFAADGIRCNAICPGIIDTPNTRLDDGEELRQLRFSKTLAGRYGTPQDIAAAAIFLAGDEAEFITGSALMVDSGWSII